MTLMGNRNNYRLLLILVLISLPIFVFAQMSQKDSANLVPCGQRGSIDCGYKEFLILIENVFVYLTKYIAIPLAAGVIVVGGAKMMLAGTNASERSKAIAIIKMAVWGLVIVLAAFLIVKLVFTTLVEPKVIPDNFK